MIAEYVNGALGTEYVYAGSQLLASIQGGTPKYYHPDHLSARVITDSTGAVAAQRGHFPFGEAWYETGQTDKWKFTSYERDPESLLDYAGFRYDASRLGRFMTPDPLAGSITDPQSLNRYAYVRNDPINLIDPLGLECQPTPDGRVQCPPTTVTVTAQAGSAEPLHITFWGFDAAGNIFGIDLGQFLNSLLQGGEGPGDYERIKQVNQCAAQLANTLSIASLANIQNPLGKIVFSNNASSLSQLVFGPDRTGGATTLTVNFGGSPALNTAANAASRIKVDRGFQFLFSSVPATTFGKTAVGGLAVSGTRGLAKALSIATAIQLPYDAGVYIAALIVCSETIQ